MGSCFLKWWLKLGIEKLNKIFNPKRIAVIGASEREGSIGAKILRNLIGVGYNGAVFPVNAFRETVQGITAYPSISKIPRTIDLSHNCYTSTYCCTDR